MASVERRPAALSPGRALRRWWWVVPALGLVAGGVVLSTWLLQEIAAAPAVSGHHDFLAFHSAARIVTGGTPRDLYSASALTGLERQVIASPVGAAGYMPYLSPPFAAVVQAPLGWLSEPVARDVWLLINVPLALLCAWLATAAMRRRERVLAVVLIMATFPVYQALVEGQWSFVMLIGCLVATRALRTDHHVTAGVALAALALKPPLLLPILVLLLCARAWRVAAALLLTVGAIVVLTLPLTGFSTQVDYAGYLVAVLGSHLAGAGAAGATVWEGGLGLTEGVNGVVAGYIGQGNVVLVDGLTLVLIAAVAARWAVAARRVGLSFRGRSGCWLAVSGISALLLTDIHLYPQDCVLLLVALPFLLGLVDRSRHVVTVLALAAALDAVWLDQLSVTTHLLAWVLGAALLFGTRAALAAADRPARGAATARRVPATADG